MRSIIASLFFLGTAASQAAALTGTETAEQFFDKVAGILLKEDLAVDLHHISIYPNNAYSREVHRLLQVTANLYDSTTNHGDAYPFFPTCFRPRFATNGTEVSISGYVEEPAAGFMSRPWREVEDPADRPINPDDNVYGIPIIIGARKGFPNFNEFAIQSVAQFTRKIEVRKDQPGGMLIETNQMMIIGISNTVGLEFWNPWTNAYPRPLRVTIVSDTTSMLTNETGFAQIANHSEGTNFVISTGALLANAFRVPILATDVILPNSVYRSLPEPHFDPINTTNVFEHAGVRTNQWALATKTRLLFYLFDDTHLVDFVAISDLRTATDVSAAVSDRRSDPYAVWDPSPAEGVTLGVKNQLEISRGNVPASDSVWLSYCINPVTGSDRQKAMDRFRAFLQPASYSTNVIDVAMQAPFIPTRRIAQSTSWEVNDPFVHQRRNQLLANGTNPWTYVEALGLFQTVTLSDPDRATIGRLNRRYSPYPPGFAHGPEPNFADLGVVSPNWWQFPSGSPLSLSTIGQIHRGTPWQSIYLKSEAASDEELIRWSGDPSGNSTNDWQLISILWGLLNANAPDSLLSVNSANFDEWASAFDGMSITTNTDNCDLVDLTISANAEQLVTIVDAINLTRTNSTYFDSIGSLLSVPELTLASPWLGELWMFCLNDAMLEAIPSQLLPKLRPDPVAHLLRGSPAQFWFSVIPGHSYEVQTSDDLRHWRGVSTNAVDETTFTFSTPANLNEAHRFYRLKLLQ